MGFDAKERRRRAANFRHSSQYREIAFPHNPMALVEDIRANALSFFCVWGFCGLFGDFEMSCVREKFISCLLNTVHVLHRSQKECKDMLMVALNGLVSY